MAFEGAIEPASFVEFAEHRSGRLSLKHRVITAEAHRVVVALDGADALVDAYEMALSLGPADCLIREVRRLPDRLAR